MLHWNVDPVAFALGPITVHWYGIFFALAFWQGLMFMRRAYIREGRDPAELDLLLGYVAGGVLIGARLAHCFFYDPVFYTQHPLEILKIWKGGLASHGGTAGLVLGVWLFLRRFPQMDLLWLLDRLSIPGALGGMCIRLGNLMNSEILGVPATVPWAMVFERVDNVPRHPVQLYEALAYGVIGAVLFLFSKTGLGRRKGALTGWCLLFIFGARFILEFFKTPQAVYEAGFTLSVGQWLSLPVVLVGAWLVWSRRNSTS